MHETTPVTQDEGKVTTAEVEEVESRLGWGGGLLILTALGSMLVVSLQGINGIWNNAPTYYAMLTKTPLEGAFGECGNPCVITYNTGGNVDVFKRAANSLKEGDVVVIDGECGSACILFADWGRPQVCVTKKARFWFHLGRVRLDDSLVYVIPPHSPDILKWVQEHGHFPLGNSAEDPPLSLAYPETLRFWTQCDV